MGGISKVREWLEVLGLFGIIGSLIFVGLEMRQAQQIAISNTNQSRTDTTVGLLLSLATEPILLSAQAKISSGLYNELTLEEQIAMRNISSGTMMIYENIHYQYLNGFIPPERWQGTLVNLQNTLRLPDFRQHFGSNPDRWSAQFRQLVDGIIEKIEESEQQ